MSSDKEALIDFANAIEAACVKLRMSLGDSGKTSHSNTGAAVDEAVFTQLKWDSQHSDKMGDYDIAGKDNNNGAAFDQAYKVLQQNNASIKDRYHGNGYVYSYWLYGEGKIYRQKLKGAKA